jgi:hypothetical protein
MPKYLARQPDGNFSLFCTNVDSFIARDLTEESILSHHGANIWRGADAMIVAARLEDAKADGPPWNNGVDSADGLSRFRVGLRIMAQMHGLDTAVEFAEGLKNFNSGVEAEVDSLKEEAQANLASAVR